MAGMRWCGEAEGLGEALQRGWLLQFAVDSYLLNISVALGRAWFVPGSVLSPARPHSLGPCPRGASICWDMSCVLWGWGLCAAAFQEQFSEQVIFTHLPQYTFFMVWTLAGSLRCLQ